LNLEGRAAHEPARKDDFFSSLLTSCKLVRYIPMKLCRFQSLHFSAAQISRPQEEPALEQPDLRWGVITDAHVQEISGELAGEWKLSGKSFPLTEIKLAAPIEPSKIVCVGRNYREHAVELGNELPQEPLIFLKPPSSIVGPGEPIVLPVISQRVDHEGELAVVIGRTCAHLNDDADIRPYIFGYTCVNDVTARDIQKREQQFTRAKSFDTFCPLGPVIETELDVNDVLVETYVNGNTRQSGRTSLMNFGVDYLVRWISRMMTLVPGDVIATGTPAGVAALAPGDVVEVAISGVGTLSNPVVARQT
jgi:2-keto-4-pentenoate hydratase/2-oxohepta-3-ene-1,7-dioic acid hydratase in catechol pathway